MRVKPGGRRRLVDLEDRTPCASRLDDLMWPAIEIAGHREPVPVHGRAAIESILDRHFHIVTVADPNDRSEDGCRISVRGRRLSLDKFVPA
jgi:hypothetical protein